MNGVCRTAPTGPRNGVCRDRAGGGAMRMRGPGVQGRGRAKRRLPGPGRAMRRGTASAGNGRARPRNAACRERCRPTGPGNRRLPRSGRRRDGDYQARGIRVRACAVPGRRRGNAPEISQPGQFRPSVFAGVLDILKATSSSRGRDRKWRLLGRSCRGAGMRSRPARRNMQAHQFRFRQECPLGPLRQPQGPALRRGQVLLRDRHSHLSLAHGPHGTAGKRCPVVVNGIGLRRARNR